MESSTVAIIVLDNFWFTGSNSKSKVGLQHTIENINTAPSLTAQNKTTRKNAKIKR